jgi:GNAT superfamily N-acetyltransferase
MSATWRTFVGPDEAGQIYQPLTKLFERCFGQLLPERTWKRLYVDNPYGDAVSCAGFVGDRMIAHHGLIPQILLNERGDSLTYWLLITLMVDPEYRGKGAFRKLTEVGHEYARASGLDCILGFPNPNSYMPLKALHGWETIQETELLDWRCSPTEQADWKPKELSSWRLGPGWNPPNNEKFRQWRCAGQPYEALELPGARVIVKTYDNVLNLLDVEVSGPQACRSVDELMTLRKAESLTLTRYHAEILGVPHSRLSSHDGYVLRFCMAAPKREFDFSEFRLNLLATDTF